VAFCQIASTGDSSEKVSTKVYIELLDVSPVVLADKIISHPIIFPSDRLVGEFVDNGALNQWVSLLVIRQIKGLDFSYDIETTQVVVFACRFPAICSESFTVLAELAPE